MFTEEKGGKDIGLRKLSSGEILPPDLVERVESSVAECDSIDSVKEIRRQLAAVRAYVVRKQHKVELARSTLICERRIGELLGPGERGNPHGALNSHVSEIKRQDRYRFRLLAEFWEVALECWSKGVYSRTRIIDEIVGQKQTEPIEKSGSGRFVTSLDELISEGFKARCIYADPPWKYSNQGTRASTSNHYESMSVEELCGKFAEQVAALADETCHLHLWTTNAFLFECPAILERWGFVFKSSFVWVKPQIGIGNYWRNSHEFLLLGVKGSLTARALDLCSWVEYKRSAHSQKPEIVREMVERLSPGPYLELFGRRRIDGWTVFGNELRSHQTRLYPELNTGGRSRVL